MIFFLLGPALALAGLVIPKARTPLLWAGALVQLLMFAELLASLEMLLIDGPLWAVAPLAALGALPLLVELAHRPQRNAVIALAGLAAILWVAALAMPALERRAAARLHHRLCPQRCGPKGALGGGEQAGPAARKLEQLRPVAARSPALQRAHPLAGEGAADRDPAAASVTKVGEMRRGDRRLVRLRLSSGGANTIALRFDKKVPILAMGLPGAMRRIDQDADVEPSFLRCSGRACDNLTLDVEIGTSKPVEAKLIAARFGLPPEGAKLQAIRPRQQPPPIWPRQRHQDRQDQPLTCGARNLV